MREKLSHLLLITGFVALFYSNSFGNFFVWNDWTLIIENFLVRDWSNLPEIFSSAFWKPLIGEPSQIYRPLLSISFMADFSLWGLKPWGYHLTNTLLHVLNSFLVYFLMRNFVSPTTALTGTLLFAIHPIHTEAVTYISGRGELLMSFFLLGGVVAFLKSERPRSLIMYLASLPLFFCALLAKEVAVVFPLFLLVADITVYSSPWKSEPLARLKRHIGPLAVLGIYYLMRKFFVGMTAVAYGLGNPDFSDHLFLTLKALPLYLGRLLFPINLHFLHPLEVSTPFDLQVWLSLVLLLGAGWLFRYARGSGNQAMAFALLWSLIGLLPLVFFTGSSLPLLESWIYLPSLGCFLFVSIGVDRLRLMNSSRIHLWLSLLIAVLLGGVAFYRNRDWKDDLTISLQTVAASPNDPVALRLLGNAFFRWGRTPEAESTFQKATLLAPGDPRLHESLGRLYSFLGKDQEALERYQRMRELTPNEPYPYWRLGRYHLRRGNLVEAEGYFERAARIFPYSSELHNDLASAYFRQGKLDQAKSEIEAALKILPNSPVLTSNLGQVLRQSK